ncbi:MAG: MSHA biogenesis protein MshI, partial [Cellvibrio sp.]
LGKELERRTQIFNIIVNKNIGNNSGFSEHLKAMGRQSLTTVSLSAFSLQQGGNYTEFIGTTQSADQIPLYIQNLRGEPVFAPTAFGVLRIQPGKTNSSIFEFSVAKQVNEADKEDAPLTAVQHLLKLNEEVRGAP